MDLSPDDLHFLIIAETNKPSFPPDENKPTYQLLICPARPLYCGSTVQLLLAIDLPANLSFFPMHISPPCKLEVLPVLGVVAAAKMHRRDTIEFIIKINATDARADG
ncbi:hypothetical protein GY45DRAFT_1263249 [Cubamyces sp. BRFM 1775]|nr:hypothetical protein GY45DRAFT_1263249 [Cubamyces sp. BRFM 1775]